MIRLDRLLDTRLVGEPCGQSCASLRTRELLLLGYSFTPLVRSP